MQFTDLKAQYTALKSSVDERIRRVLEHGQYIMGPEVRELEQALCTFTGARHCLTVASGTEALLISLMALDIKAGDEVITSPFTFAATAEAIALLGAVPVFVDIEPDTGLIDAALIEPRITPRTRAIMPVSLYGQCADMDAINAIAQRHGLAVIEDAAQSFGARYTGRRSGHLSTIACTSFFPSKPLGCYGDGGALFTDDDGLAEAARQIRVHGQSARYQHARVGVGGRMDTLQCAVVLAKLERFEWELERRQMLGARYTRLLSDAGFGFAEHAAPDVVQSPIVRRSPSPGQLLLVRPDRDSVYGQYTVLIPHRDAVHERLKALGIPTAIHYPLPLHHQAAYARYCCPECCPLSIAAAQQVLSLPMSADLREADQDRVVAALVDALRGAAGEPN